MSPSVPARPAASLNSSTHAQAAEGASSARSLRGAEALAGYTVYYGGSFNPGHIGHVEAGVALLQRGAEELWLAPAAVHADKQLQVPFEQRMRLCRLLADAIDRRLPERLQGRVHVQDVEARVDSRGQSVRVMAHLNAAYPERKFAFALGSDCLQQAPTWDGWAELQTRARIVELPREGHATTAHGDVLDVRLPKVSSTDIRTALGAGTPPAALSAVMPPAVASFVEREKLYGPSRPVSGELAPPPTPADVLGKHAG